MTAVNAHHFKQIDSWNLGVTEIDEGISHVQHFHQTCYARTNIVYIVSEKNLLQLSDVSKRNCAIQTYCDK